MSSSKIYPEPAVAGDDEGRSNVSPPHNHPISIKDNVVEDRT